MPNAGNAEGALPVLAVSPSLGEPRRRDAMNGSEERESAAALAATVSWLEDELREAKSQLLRQQQTIDQLGGQLWDVTAALHKAEDLLAALPPRLAALPELDERLRALKDDLAALHEQTLHGAGRVAELGRAQQLDTERDRTVLNDLTRRLETAERGLQGGLPRFEALDEAGRRALELIGQLRQRMEAVERQVEATEARLGRVVDSGGRVEQEFTRLNGEVESLRGQDVTLGERLHVYSGMIKRLEGDLAMLGSEVGIGRDALERIDLNRLEVHRLEERLSLLEATASELRDRGDDAHHQLSLLEGRDKGIADRLTSLQGELAASRAQFADQFGRLHQVQERLKRRQIEDLEREIRELRIHAFRTPDE